MLREQKIRILKKKEFFHFFVYLITKMNFNKFPKTTGIIIARSFSLKKRNFYMYEKNVSFTIAKCF